MVKIIILLSICILLAGCGSQNYSCGVPSGNTCTSLSQVYRSIFAVDARQGSSVEPAPVRHSRPAIIKQHAPRIWVAPWKDARGNKYSAMYLYPDSEAN